MEIKIAEHSGFCFGVSEAIRKTEELIDKYKDTDIKVYTCGPLIHNKSVTDNLCKRGLNISDSLASVEPGSILIIRSHGEPKSFYDEAYDANLKIVDATCPYVSKIHKIVEKAHKEGRNVVVIGDATHPEVRGIVGWAEGKATVINSLEEAADIDFDNITLVAQTTITGNLWDSIAGYLAASKNDVMPIRTICSATDKRQSSCEKLALESDVMIVIGDLNSANSRKLHEIARKNCKNAYFVENKNDLPLKRIEICDRIGVAAGASTPERIIKEVISTMSESITEIKEMQNAAAEDNTANEETVVDVQATENVPVAETESDVESDAVSETEKVPEVEDATETESDVTTEEASLDAAPSEEESNPMDDFMDEIDKQMILPNRGEVVEGEIVHVTDREIVVNLGCKKDGIIPKDELILKDGQELTDMFKAGDNIQAKVVKTDDGEGNILLSKKKLVINEHWDEINEALDNKAIVNAKVVREVKGGVIAVYKEVSGFIPMSQLSDRYVEKADEFIGKVLPVKVSRVDQRRNKAVFSHKAHLMEEKQKRIQEIWNALNVGDIVEGTVMRFTDYGAFVDIGGLDGLLHISEISWGKLKHPSEALDIGERIDVKILSMNSEKGKISLGLKQTQPEPWSVIDERYEAGQTISGKVVQIKEYGAFVELEPGLDGLVHISEIAHKRVTNIMDELSIGEIVQIKILDIDKERRRISLSIKETLDDSIMSEGSESAITDVADKVEVDDAEDVDVSEDEKAEIVMDEPKSSEEEAEAVAEEAETEETEETKESAE